VKGNLPLVSHDEVNVEIKRTLAPGVHSSLTSVASLNA
jgi:hypothetical protein